MANSRIEYTLIHPIYLDIAMMESFLAFLEGGVAKSESETSIAKDARDKLLKVRSGFRFKVISAVDVDAGGEGSKQWKDENSKESKTERHHTEASLFNILYQYLLEDDKLAIIGKEDDLKELRSGQLVELVARYLGNPLEEVLAFFESILPYISESKEAKKNIVLEALDARRSASKSGNPSKRPGGISSDEEGALRTVLTALEDDDDSGIQMIQRMADDIKKSSVHDLLVAMNDDTKAVLTVASEYYSATTVEYLKASEFRVIGKVTNVLSGQDSINLTRRTVLGAAGPDMARQVVQSVSEGDIKLSVADPIVDAPGVQIIPLAIFV